MQTSIPSLSRLYGILEKRKSIVECGEVYGNVV